MLRHVSCPTIQNEGKEDRVQYRAIASGAVTQFCKETGGFLQMKRKNGELRHHEFTGVKLAQIDHSRLVGEDATTYQQAMGLAEAAHKTLEQGDYLTASGLAEN